MTWSWMVAGGVLLPVMAMVQDGACRAGSSAAAGGTVITGSGTVTGCGAGRSRSTAATIITTTKIPPTIRYGINKLFSLMAIRQFGQMVRLESMRAPQCWQVLLLMHPRVIFAD